MDRSAALLALPEPYGLALDLRDEGESSEVIAAAAGVELDAVPALLEIGDAKLAALLEDTGG